MPTRVTNRLISRIMILVLLVCLCGTSSHVFATEMISVTDMAKRTVQVPFPPTRIICLSPGTLRLIIYLQASGSLVGVEDFEKTRPSGRPYILACPELLKLPTVGPGGPGSINNEPDLEAVLKVKPDLIFISYMEPANADALQKKLGIPVVVLTHGRFGSFDEAIYGSLQVAGKVLQRERRAEEVISYIEDARKDLGARTEGIPDTEKPRVYVGAVGYKASQGIESTDASYTPLEWVNAANLAKTICPEGHLFIDKEKLLAWDPEIIFIDGGHMVRLDYGKRPEFYNALKAFRENRVYIIHPFNYYVTNVSTALVDAYAVGKILYPERFADIEPREKADEFYTFLYGKPLQQQMENDYGALGRRADFGAR